MNALMPITTIEGDAASHATSLLALIARASSDPAVDADKMKALLDMHREIMGDESRVAFNRAFATAQSEMRAVTRDAVNDQTRSKYARLETIDAAIRPIYTAHGFAMSFDSEPQASGNVLVVCEIMHSAGFAKTYRLEAAPDMTGAKGNANKTAMHGLGSAVTYLRRYLKLMVWDIALVDEDTDGNRSTSNEGGHISEAQVRELWNLMTSTGTNEGRFLAAMAPNLRSIAQAPATDYARLKNALLTKANMLAQRAETARNPRTGHVA